MIFVWALLNFPINAAGLLGFANDVLGTVRVGISFSACDGPSFSVLSLIW